MRSLAALGYELIPLRAKEKIPLETGWRTRVGLTLEEAEALREEGYNVGVRLRGVDLVVDVDPRNFPEGRRPDHELGLGELVAPRVITPSGGQHIYLRLREGSSVRHTLAAYPGVEFKTLGRQVVAPGSVHPNGGLYHWDELSPPVEEVGFCPDSLMTVIEVQINEGEGTDGEWSCEQLRVALSGLDAHDFGDHDRWFSVMCAAHEATGGQGIEEFVEWSMSDELFAGDEKLVRHRWKTLTTGKLGGAGIGTLRKLLLEVGKGGLVAPVGVGDFEDEIVEEPLVMEVPETLLQKMSRWFRVVDEDGKMRVFAQRHDEVLERKYWVRYTRRDFLEVCQSVLQLPQVQVGKNKKGEDKFMPAGLYWLDEHKKKETYKGVTFAPEHDGDRTPDGRMNLWRGFAVEGKRGEWGWLRELIYEVICRGDGVSDDYVMNWLARAVQRPWEPGGVALVVKGIKGTGKGTLGRAFMKLFGQHGLHIASPDLITGRFNAHLRDCVALFADEAFWAGDKTGESKLKALVTEPALAFEGKGQNAEMGRNCLHIYMASNMDWVVPSGFHHERRFAIMECLEEKGSEAGWRKLTEQMKNGGLAAMLWDLAHRDLGKFDVRRVPQTQALINQKVRTMEPHEQWLFGLLDSGEWEQLPTVGRNDRGMVVLAVDMQSSLFEFYRTHNRFRAGLESVRHQLGLLIKKMVPASSVIRVNKPADRLDLPGRPWAYSLPNLIRARKDLEQIIGIGLWSGDSSDKEGFLDTSQTDVNY